METCTSGKWAPALVPCPKGCAQQGVVASCRVCEPGVAECSDGYYEGCRADGVKFDPTKRVVCAGETPVCNAALGGCRACSPGQKSCVGAASVACNATGAFDLVNATACGSAALCVNGECVAPVCTGGTILCANDLQSYTTCKADGSGYDGPVSLSLIHI